MPSVSQEIVSESLEKGVEEICTICQEVIVFKVSNPEQEKDKMVKDGLGSHKIS